MFMHENKIIDNYPDIYRISSQLEMPYVLT